MKIGVPNPFARFHMPRLLGEYVAGQNKIQIKTIPNSSDIIIQQLTDGSIDIGGKLSMGGDSHTPYGGAIGMLCICLGKVFEYVGPGAAALEVSERATITNMGAEMGATTSIFPADGQVRRFLKAQQREGLH